MRYYQLLEAPVSDTADRFRVRNISGVLQLNKASNLSKHDPDYRYDIEVTTGYVALYACPELTKLRNYFHENVATYSLSAHGQRLKANR